MEFFQKKSNIKPLLIIFIIWFITINFETAQQLFYIRRYNLSPDSTYWSIFIFQTYRWIVWGISSFLLVIFAKNKNYNNSFTIQDFYFNSILIIALVVADILIISFIEMFISQGQFNLSLLFSEFIPFFTFQKGPIYTLGFIAVSIILHFYYSNKNLQIEVLKLEELKKSNSELYAQLKTNFNEKESFLNIKVGNTQKVIPVSSIYWIEADDYCSRIHTIDAPSYAMRISLKALEEKLNSNFLRVHRSAIVNMKVVKEFQSQPVPKLNLTNGASAPVSKSKIKTVKDFLTKISIPI